MPISRPRGRWRFRRIRSAARSRPPTAASWSRAASSTTGRGSRCAPSTSGWTRTTSTPPPSTSSRCSDSDVHALGRARPGLRPPVVSDAVACILAQQGAPIWCVRSIRKALDVIRDFQETAMALHIGDVAPDFTANTTQGRINFHEWIGDGWAILFSHPKDFTPVCTTELGYMAGLKPEFDKRNTKLIGLSCDSVEDHNAWVKDIEETQGHAVNYPIIDGSDLSVAKAYDMIHPNASGDAKSRTAVDNQTVRSVFIIGPDKRIKATFTYPMSSGRNFDEVLRLLDSIQLTEKHQVATPVNWKPGDDVIIPPSVSDDAAKQKYPDGFRTLKPYLRYVQQPR